MQDAPLTLPHFVQRAERLFHDKELVTATATGREHTDYGTWAERTHRLGGVIDDLGISETGRVATFAWNTARHLELYFAAPCTGRVLHTLNIRLFPEQLTYIANHAEDEVIFVDRSLMALLWPLVSTFETVRHLVVMDDGKGEIPSPDGGSGGPLIHDYEDLLAAASPVDFRVDDENRAASMCYTSGTTGNPKGVVYSHRSTFLHTLGAMTASSLGVTRGRPHPPGRADVPRQRLGPRPRRRRRRGHARHARPRPVRPEPRCPHRGGAGDDRGRRADHLDGRAPRAQGPRHVGAAGHPVRRLGRAPGAVGGLPRADRPADHAGLGHDRDEPRRIGRAHQVDARRHSRRRRTRRPAHDRRAALGVRGGPHRPARLRGAAAVGRRGLGRAAGRRAVDRGVVLQRRALAGVLHRRRLAQDRRRGHDRPRTATSASSTARRTSSSPAASGSAPSSSRTS